MVQNVIQLCCTRSLPVLHAPLLAPAKGWEALQALLGTFGPSLDNCPEYIITAGGGPYASLLDGNKMTTYVCNTLCAVYNIPTTQEKSIFFRAYMVFI